VDPEEPDSDPVAVPAAGVPNTGVPASDVTAIGAPIIVGPASNGGGRSRWLYVGIGAALLVVAAVVVIVLATSSSSGPFSPGVGSATITWTSAATGNDESPPQPFGGTINGVPVSGVNTTDLSGIEGLVQGAAAKKPLKIHLFEIKGTFDGKAFALGVFVEYPHGFSLGATESTFPKIDVVGTYGNEKVQASLMPPASDLSNPEALNSSTPMLFKGTIGDLEISGQVQEPTKHGSHNTAKATFTISS
jgi:hypothetical protein